MENNMKSFNKLTYVEDCFDLPWMLPPEMREFGCLVVVRYPFTGI